MLSDVLETDEKPVLRPVKIVGHHAMLGGQYPAIKDGEPDDVVAGFTYVVQSVKDGKRLAQYETRNYEIRPCSILYTDEATPTDVEGYAFMFAGDRGNLKEGLWTSACGSSESVEPRVGVLSQEPLAESQ